MKKNRLSNAIDIRRWRLCVGCGACVFACKHGNIVMEDVAEDGLRPVMKGLDCQRCGKCLEVCPGIGIPRKDGDGMRGAFRGLLDEWGPILGIWEGYAADPEIRYRGSSGGVATAVALSCLETNTARGGVLHIGPSPSKPWCNQTALSRNRKDLISKTGSRYSPASPCDGLERLELAEASGIFIGKPCDVHGLRKAESLFPILKEKAAVAISIFCAGTPATAGTQALLRRLGITAEEVSSMRYRGNGWPGDFWVQGKEGNEKTASLSYAESWSFLQGFRPFRCHICPDGTGEFADISCGDPWYREIRAKEKGYSLVLVRTEKGRQIVRQAIETGYVILNPVEPWVLEASQANLLAKRRAIWGRLFALKMLRIPVPDYEGFHLYGNWRLIRTKEKARSFIGTVRRVLRRRYYRPLEI